MKQYNTTVKSKQELITDLMFAEIISLRKEAARLSTLVWDLAEEIKDAQSLHQHLKDKAAQALREIKNDQ